MKLLLLLVSILLLHTSYAQVKDGNKNKQVEQLQQMKLSVSRKIDSLHMQLSEDASTIDDLHKQIELLKKDAHNQEKPDNGVNPSAKPSPEYVAATNQLNCAQKKYDQRMIALDKALNLEKDLEEKIITLEKEKNE